MGATPIVVALILIACLPVQVWGQGGEEDRRACGNPQRHAGADACPKVGPPLPLWSFSATLLLQLQPDLTPSPFVLDPTPLVENAQCIPALSTRPQTGTS